jgi:nuclear receptor interaction protein
MADIATTHSELNKRLLFRELGYKPASSGIYGIYGDKAWIDDLDIVNELGGHTGCVNALRYAYPSAL